VSTIGNRIIVAARRHVGEKLAEAKTEEEIQQWTEAARRLKGEWHYIVTNSQAVNAFISDLLPRRIFVHEGMLKVTFIIFLPVIFRLHALTFSVGVGVGVDFV
jgi:hypothetical protein